MTIIKMLDTIPSDIDKIMREDLVGYEASHGIDVNYKCFALIARNELNEPIGVLNAFTAFSEVYIEDMWVSSIYRGIGIGRSLIEDLEARFRDQGFNNINLVTNQFNAPDFYKKLGFELEFTRINHKNPKLTKYFFIKYFHEEIETQGVLPIIVNK